MKVIKNFYTKERVVDGEKITWEDNKTKIDGAVIVPKFSEDAYAKGLKLATVNDITWANVLSKPTTATRWPTWDEVTSKPSTFAPATHSHAWSTITGKPGKFEPLALPIPGNDLNNAMAPGFYYWTTGTANSPVDYGSMVVTAWDGTGGQTAEQFVMKNGSMWIRGKNNSAGAWSAWTRISTVQVGVNAFPSSPKKGDMRFDV